MNDYSVSQSSNIRPPRVGQVVALAVDATSRAYDLSKLAWNGIPAGKLGQRNHFYLSIQCESNDVYFLLSSTAQGSAETIDDTAAIAAGSAMVLPSTPFPPAHLVAGTAPVDIRIDRQVDVTLIVKCAATKTATLRFWPSSQNDASAEE